MHERRLGNYYIRQKNHKTIHTLFYIIKHTHTLHIGQLLNRVLLNGPVVPGITEPAQSQ